MKRISIILSATVSMALLLSCGGTQQNETIESEEEVVKEITVNKKENTNNDKTPVQILEGGSWNNPEAAMAEDVIFNKGGKMIWRSGNDEGEGEWSIKGTDILNFYGKDYKIEELSETKLIVSYGDVKTTYERNEVVETACDAPFKIEGTNDAKGEYKLGNNESWTIHFSEGDQDFIAFYTKDGKQDEAMIIEKIEKLTNCEYKIIMKGISGEMVPTWVLKYNIEKKYYDLNVHSYNAETDKWYDSIFLGSMDNG